jgi:hypothetical protein
MALRRLLGIAIVAAAVGLLETHAPAGVDRR